MATYLFSVIMSFLVNLILIVPFIDYLYKLKLQRPLQKGRDVLNKPTPIFNRFHQHKTGTPVGGGILILLTTVFIYLIFIFTYLFIYKKIPSNYPSVIEEVKIILFAFISFSFLGLFDDLSKIFFWKKNKFFGLRIRHKLILESILALITGYWLYAGLKINIIYIPYFGVFNIGIFYILFAAFVIVSFCNAVNITDGLDGLATGVLVISLGAFWVISRSILDVPTSLFISAWLGALLAFLYFNIYPARIFLGDAGALSFGATFAVIGLILGKSFSLIVIGGIFVIEILTSLIQILAKKILKRKILPVAPLHLWLQYKGWEEPKIVMRAWLMAIVFSIFGLMIAFMK
ncbi:MAG: phospho-N-acetylmuramoyl-pentapeptide-transferase [Microgenomates group bacterium]